MKELHRFIFRLSLFLSILFAGIVALTTNAFDKLDQSSSVVYAVLVMLLIIAVQTGILFAIIKFAYYLYLKRIEEQQDAGQDEASLQLQNNSSIDIKDGDIFYYYGDYHYGYSRVEKVHVIHANTQEMESVYAYADETGEIVTKWYSGATDFQDPGFAVVLDEGMYYFLSAEDCKSMLLNGVYRLGDSIEDGKIKVFWNDGTMNFMDFKKKALLWPEWKQVLG